MKRNMIRVIAQSWEYTIDGSTLTMKDVETGSTMTYTLK